MTTVGSWTAEGKLVPGIRRRMEQQYDELRWRMLLASWEWFFVNCLRIPSAGDDGHVPFELYDYQLDGMRRIMGTNRSVVLKARQLGWTTMMSALALWQALHRGSTVLYVSKNQDAANKALGLVRFMWTFLPGWVTARGPALTSNQAGKMEWTWPDGQQSKIISLAATRTAGAGETADLVIVDEFALSEYQDDALRTLLPTISARQGRIVVFSTARGAHNRFAKLFKEAWFEPDSSDFTAIFHPWMVSRIFDQDDYDAEAKRFAATPWLLYAEYPSSVEEAFRESGRPRFTGLPPDAPALTDSMTFASRNNEIAGQYIELETDPPDAKIEERGHLWGWPELLSPRSEYEYVLAIDPSSGTGGDYTVGTVFRRDGRDVRLVAEWRSNTIEPIRAAREFNVLGMHFHEALIVVETTGGWGDSYINELVNHLNYRNMYVHVADAPRGGRINRYGYPMSWQKRPKVIDRLASLLRYDLPDEVGQPVILGLHEGLLNELNTFVTREDGKVAADVGCYDDRVMSGAIGVTVLTDHTGMLVEQAEDKRREPGKVQGNLKGLVERNERIHADKIKAARKQHRRMVRGLARRARRRERSRRR